MLKREELTDEILSSAIGVHRHLGPGLLESAYEECLCREFTIRGIKFERLKELPIVYKGKAVDTTYRVDIIVEGEVVLELKSVESLIPIHQSQLLTYMKLSGIGIGLLLNFNTVMLKDGIKRVVL